MAENNNVPTPERDLLKIIESKEVEGRVTSQGSLRKGLSLFSLGALKGRLSFFRGNLLKLFSGGATLEISSINRVLFIAVLAMLIFMSFDFFNSMMNLNEDVDRAFQIDRETSVFSSQELSPLKSSSFYLEKARKRDIFKMVSQTVKEEEEEEAKTAQEANKGVRKMTANLNLVGISWSDDPDAMIEDAKTKRTYFLKRGDSIGEVVVSGIFKDRVVLSYNGEEVELK